MKLYLIRHGVAEERHIFAKKNKNDDDRPLVEKGRSRLKKIAQSLLDYEPKIDTFIQSPLLRSKQSVQVFKKYYPDSEVITSELLKPGFSCEQLFQKIQSHMGQDAVAIVGHEPDLGQFLSWILFGVASERFPMKKGAIAKVDLFEDGSRYLKWFLRPKFFYD